MHFRFITPCVNEAFFVPVKRAAQDAADAIGATVSFIGTEDVDVHAQLAMVRESLDCCDGLAISIPDPEAFDALIDEALGKGVGVVAFNVDARPRQRQLLSAIVQDFYHAGEKLGARAKPHIPAGANVLFTMHSEGICALDERMRGMRDALADRNIHSDVLITGMEEQKAAELILEALSKRPAAAVLCTGQADTEGAGIAKTRGFPDLYVAGFDLSPNILGFLERGVVDATVDQQPYAQGFYPVMQLYLYKRFGILPSSMDAGSMLVTKANVDRYLLPVKTANGS